MPVNKNAYLRYKILDECFQNKHRRFNIDQLVDYVSDKLGYNISLRQIRDDISILRLDYEAPIVATKYDGKKCYYHYDREHSIFKNQLSIEEVAKLRTTIDMLGKFRGIPANAWLEEVISSLECHLGTRPNTENLISFDKNDQLKGLEHLSGLIDVTINHQTIDIDYQVFGRDKRHLTVSPYYIKQYNGRWFLFGLNDSKNRIESYALDRIENYQLSSKAFVKNETTDFSTFFDDVIGVSVPYGDVAAEEIVLRFTENRFPYVVSKPIHPSQKILDEPNTISITVKPNRELFQQIFSFIPDIEVVSPEWFRNEIREKIQENLNKYFSVQNDSTEEL